MTDDSVRIAIVCEANADFQTASTLADRAVCEHPHLVSWLNPDLLPHLRCYRGRDETQDWFSWFEIKDLANELSIVARGHFNNQPQAPDAAMAVRAIRVVRRLLDVDAIMLIRDDDGVPERRVGFEQAKAHEAMSNLALVIVFGIATTKRECWVLAGFDPKDQHEEQRLANERQNLGFDPREEAHRLTAKHDAANDKLSAKRVLGNLCGEDANRERSCLEETELDTLRRRGKYSGLSEFLNEVDIRLVPLLSSRH